MQLQCPRGISLFTAEDRVAKLPKDFKFPAMVKQLQASGSLAAHDMAVVWRSEDIDQFKYPLYVQEYINHDGTIFKIYVLGDLHFNVVRVSLPNFPHDYQAPVRFNSQDWKHELPPELTKEYTGKRKAPEEALISNASHCVSSLLGLSLFGFDVIENVDTGKLAIIDVNYFPGTCLDLSLWPRPNSRTALPLFRRPLAQAVSTHLPTLSLHRPFTFPMLKLVPPPFGVLHRGAARSFLPPRRKLTPFVLVLLLPDYRGVPDIFGKLLQHILHQHAARKH